MPGSTDTRSTEGTGEPVLLATLAWPEVAALRGRVLLLPVGATEQHGPHLPLNTDTLIAEAVCAQASALTGAPVLPALSYGVSLGHTEQWPGTFSFLHETLSSAIREIARWAAATGWSRLLVVNGHCGNDAPLRCAIDRLRFDTAGRLLVALRNTWQLSPEILAHFTRDAADWHANEAETSLLLHLAPAAVRTEQMAAADDPDRTAGCVFPHMVAHTSRNGVTGHPSQASAEAGRRLSALMAEALAAIIRRASAEEPPLAWQRTSSVFA